MGETDLISRQALKERLMYMARFRCNSEIGEPTCGLTRRTAFHMSEIMKAVIDMPTIEERKTGKWEQDNPFTKPRCSECGEPCFGLHGFDYTLTPYCPNCGTRMEM